MRYQLWFGPVFDTTAAVNRPSSLDESIALFERLGLTRQALRSRCLKVLTLLESGRDDDARRESAGIRANPDIDIPLLALLLKAGVALAVDVAGEEEERLESIRLHVARLLTGIEALPPDVTRCLQCAIRRARAAGRTERADRIEALATAVPPRPS